MAEADPKTDVKDDETLAKPKSRLDFDNIEVEPGAAMAPSPLISTLRVIPAR